ncbi:hypothetical protein UC8_21710 [Roseimaritima ulvae]|uniref:Uncharacterized protein n=1 Tax=Roseimaritima ulvae TaxID=980254 RepID=A0A5B9QS20_9BACT|nr:hypothetical protein UC8_21710 [Roseimaritima ulvae]
MQGSAGGQRFFEITINSRHPLMLVVLQTDGVELLVTCLVSDNWLNGAVCLSVRQRRLPCCRRSLVVELVFTSRTFKTIR